MIVDVAVAAHWRRGVQENHRLPSCGRPLTHWPVYCGAEHQKHAGTLKTESKNTGVGTVRSQTLESYMPER